MSKNLNNESNQDTVLVVDDDNTTLTLLEAKLKKKGYEVLTAKNGNDACDIIKDKHEYIDAVLLDRIMPDMDGLEVISWIKKQPYISYLPIIMQTGAGSEKEIKEGIDAGVFYYLTKPIKNDLLDSVVSSAVKESKQHKILNEQLKVYKSNFKSMDRCTFSFKTLNEAENVSCFIANCFQEPNRVLAGIVELTSNAVQYGIDESNEDKVELDFYKKDDNSYIKISDPGNGFNWHKFLKLDPAKALDNHGRGIARANMIFSNLQYNKQGNEVVILIDDNKDKAFTW